MENMIANGITVIDFLYYAAVFLLSIILFYNSRQQPTTLNRVLYRLWMVLFFVLCGLAYFSQRPLATRLYVTLLLVSSLVLQLAIWRRAQHLSQ